MASQDVSSKLLDSLKDSIYACRSLEKQSGGTANYVFRGILAKPLELDGCNTVVIKHTPPYVAAHPNFKLTATRCVSFQLSRRPCTLLCSWMYCFEAAFRSIATFRCNMCEIGCAVLLYLHGLLYLGIRRVNSLCSSHISSILNTKFRHYDSNPPSVPLLPRYQHPNL